MCKKNQNYMRVNLYKTTKRRVKKQSQVSNVRRSGKLETYEISQVAKFAGCELSQPCKISTELLFFSICAPKSLWSDHASFEFGSGSSCLNQIEEL